MSSFTAMQYDPFDEREQPVIAWLRRSFLCCCWFCLAIGVVDLMAFCLRITPEIWDSNQQRVWARLGISLLALVLLAAFAFVRRRGFTSRQQLVSSYMQMMIPVGILVVAAHLMYSPAWPSTMLWALGHLVLLHLIACLILPITAKESAPPFGVIGVLWAVTLLVPQQNGLDRFGAMLAVVTSPLWFIPGLWYAGWRFRRMEEQSDHARLGRQVRTLGGELSRARIVHDAMFPAEFDAGHIAFEYEYQPIQEIGGDYVHLHVCGESGRMCLTLLDVAGHGLAAALTVNRLFGELERIRAENPNAEPGEVMTLLNRYINLTMAPHSMFATGTCIMLDPATGELKWVNAGHPPALVRRLGGEIEELPCTSMLLGVESPEDYDAGEQSRALRPGDVVIAYTDGVIEAMDQHGRQFGMAKLLETAKFSPPPRNWTRFIASAVAKHRQGPADDDLLVVQLSLRGLSLSKPAAWDTVQRIEGRSPARA